jgi:hypothetical protein
MHENTRNFVNELGNPITVTVSEKEIDGIPGVLMSIAGPSSNTENHVTRLEANVIREQLSLLLGDK